jgi:hypothetical protein
LQTSEQEDSKHKLLVSLIRRIARDETYIVLDEHLENFDHKKRLDRDLESERGLTFLDDEPVVKPIFESIKGGEHKHHRLSTGEIFSHCLRLSKQLLERAGTEEGFV